MGTKRGINRTVGADSRAVVHLGTTIDADDWVETLSVARSNVSSRLKELQGWGIVRRVHVMGDKRDHFESMKDVWEMFRGVLDERKKRETDPTIVMLRKCVAEAERDKATNEYTEHKLSELAEFFENTPEWYGQIRLWPTTALTKFVKLGDKIRQPVGIGGE
jgi:DNA-binding transcriptional regulator GbsR (MarR family)